MKLNFSMLLGVGDGHVHAEIETEQELETALKMIERVRNAGASIDTSTSDPVTSTDPAVEEPKAPRPKRTRRTTPSVTSEVEAPVAYTADPNAEPLTQTFEAQSEPEPATQSETAAEPAPAAEAPAAEEAKPVVAIEASYVIEQFTNFAKAKGIAAARALVAEFNVARATDLPVEQRVAFIGRIQELSK